MVVDGQVYRFANDNLHRRSLSLGRPVCSGLDDCLNYALGSTNNNHRHSLSKRSPVLLPVAVAGLAKTLMAAGILVPLNCVGTGPAALASCPITAGTLALKTLASLVAG